MPYGIDKNDRGRWIVTSPKGKKWKTTYVSREAAEKGVAYVEGRFGGAGSTTPPKVETGTLDESPDTAEERILLGIPPKED